MVEQSTKDGSHLESARRAAQDGDPMKMLEALYAGSFPDGLLRRCKRQAESMGLGASDADAAFDEALTSTYRSVENGVLRGNPIAYAFKVSSNALSQARRRLHGQGSQSKLEEWDDGADAYGTWPIGGRHPEHLETQAISDQAIKFARSVLPELGQENIRNVMDYVIECAEAGLDILPTYAEIGEALGLTEANAKKCVQRGFTRLTRCAKNAGYRDTDSLELTDNQQEASNDKR